MVYILTCLQVLDTLEISRTGMHVRNSLLKHLHLKPLEVQRVLKKLFMGWFICPVKKQQYDGFSFLPVPSNNIFLKLFSSLGTHSRADITCSSLTHCSSLFLVWSVIVHRSYPRWIWFKTQKYLEKFITNCYPNYQIAFWCYLEIIKTPDSNLLETLGKKTGVDMGPKAEVQIIYLYSINIWWETE